MTPSIEICTSCLTSTNNYKKDESGRVICNQCWTIIHKNEFIQSLFYKEIETFLSEMPKEFLINGQHSIFDKP